MKLDQTQKAYSEGWMVKNRQLQFVIIRSHFHFWKLFSYRPKLWILKKMKSPNPNNTDIEQNWTKPKNLTAKAGWSKIGSCSLFLFVLIFIFKRLFSYWTKLWTLMKMKAHNNKNTDIEWNLNQIQKCYSNGLMVNKRQLRFVSFHYHYHFQNIFSYWTKLWILKKMKSPNPNNTDIERNWTIPKNLIVTVG